MNQLPTRKTNSISTANSPSFQSFRTNTTKSSINPNTTIFKQQTTIKPQSISILASHKPLHSHKGSVVDISSLSMLIKQHKNENTVQMSVQQNKQQDGHSQITSILSKAKEINIHNKQKHSNSQILTNKSHSRTGTSIKQSETQQQPLYQQPFVDFMQIRDMITKSRNVDYDIKEADIKSSFAFLFIIGIGGFGKVWKVEHKKKGITYALKEMSKALVITKKSVNSVMNERQLLCSQQHPFLVNMHQAFQDRENLFLVMDYMLGGDLRYHIGRHRRFNEETTKFFIACIFIGLEYLHKNDIIHRDIKPENLVLDDKGYVRITDLGIARLLKVENSNDTSGTPGYMAPEVMCRQNHSFGVDYFALGVIAYEFMMGRRPYMGRSRQEIRDQILAKQIQIKRNDVPEGWSLEGADFINKLIQRKAINRLGSNGSLEIRLHPWFNQFPWNKLQSKELQSPFIPSQNDDNFDKKQIHIEDDENSDLIQQNAILLRDNGVQELFLGYEFNCNQSYMTTDVSSGKSSSNNIHKYSNIASK